MNKIIVHIDMNSYFASVEQQANPFLRGKPVGVCAYLSPNGVIIASSMEAKAKGIKTGTKVREAKLIYPLVVLLENEPAKYREVTKAIFKIFNEYTDKVEPYSIDEAFLDLSGFIRNFKEADELAIKIQERIKNEIGEWLNCSVGISWTKFLAKFAGDIAPKKGVLVIDSEKCLNETLEDRLLTDAWGINIRTEERLKELGINNLLSLKKYNKDKIRRTMGRYGYYLWANVNGIEITSVNRGQKESKSIGHQYALAKKTSNKEYLSKILYKLCEKIGRRLRDSNREAEGISIFLGYIRSGGVGKSFKTTEKLFTTEDIFGEAIKFLTKVDLLMDIRLVSISVTRLSLITSQMSLFEDNLSKKELSKAMDKINNKYGEYTVISGWMFNANDIAKDRIGFRKIGLS